MESERRSPLEIARNSWQPVLSASAAAGGIAKPVGSPPPLAEGIPEMFPNLSGGSPVEFVAGSGRERRPMRVGVVLSGGPAPGGHNVIAGIFDVLKEEDSGSSLVGFLDGPRGLLENHTREIDREMVSLYLNTGGFDLLGSGRTKLESESDFQRALASAAANNLDGLAVIGGDDSNTNACTLAEFAAKEGSTLRVIGVPKTIDGDLRGGGIEASFGFDTACKVYSELIGNLHRDAMSSRKYWHFIKLMGRAASHIALECALQTRPNIALISEEILERNLSLHDITESITQAVIQRAENGEFFGSVLIPEGLIEFIPEMRTLIAELNDILSEHAAELASINVFRTRRQFVTECLTPESAGLYRRLPLEMTAQLIMDRDPHGNVQVAKIETGRMIREMVELRLNQIASQTGSVTPFNSIDHSFGYEGRCAAPSNFDANYGYALGRCTSLLILNNLSGYMAVATGLHRSPVSWHVGGIPLVGLLHLERRKGRDKPVIKKALVELDKSPFQLFESRRDTWATTTSYSHPGPIQYFGPPQVADAITLTLRLESAPPIN